MAARKATKEAKEIPQAINKITKEEKIAPVTIQDVEAEATEAVEQLETFTLEEAHKREVRINGECVRLAKLSVVGCFC